MDGVQLRLAGASYCESIKSKMPNLRLNEALLVISPGNISGQIAVSYQDEECFGCPLTPLKPVEGEVDKFVLDTKHDVQIEVRQLNFNTTGSSCRFNDLALNSQGLYKLDVDPGEGGKLDCKLRTLDNGECLLCPFAVLVCFLVAIMAIEHAWNKFWPEKRSKSASEKKPEASSSELANGAKQDADSGTNPGSAPPDVDQGASAQLPIDDQPAKASSSAAESVEPIQQGPNQTVPMQVAKQRIECLDIFRGMTLAGMIFVNYGGAGYPIWEHKSWDGITLADFVFPFFIFSMGASIAISVKSFIKRRRVSFGSISRKIFARSLKLLLLGIFLNSRAINYEQPDGLSRLRLTGVLQRFAISYFVVAFMYSTELQLNKWTRAQSLSYVPYLSKVFGVLFELLVATNYTAIYVYFTFYYEYDSTGKCPPGYTGPGGLTAGGQNAECTGGAAAWLDRLILGENHLYNDRDVKQVFKTQVTHDPEGLLGYTTSIVLTLIGLQCGKLMTGRLTPRQKIISLAKWTFVLATSCSLIVVIPINKRLWSLTFVSVTALAAFVIITTLYILIDILSSKKTFFVQLLSSAGKNSIFLYVAHSLIHEMLPWWFPVGNQASHMQLLFRLVWSTLVWLLIAHYMAYKKLYMKV